MTTVIANRYQIQDILGSGGMGVVYRTYDRLTGEIIALKRVQMVLEQLVFQSKMENNSNTHLALAEEFRVLASLWHPNVISVLDYGFDHTRQPYFTMSYLENHQNLLKYGADLDLSAKVALLQQVLEALIYLHRRGIIHRDLKPENVLVSADGQVRVVDFGLAVEDHQQRGLAGTIAYIAPEVLQGKPASPQSDLFSFGIMAAELLTGRYPFGADKIAIPQVMMAIFNRPANLSGLSDELSLILNRLLEKHPHERYPSAQAVQAALDEFSDSSANRESLAIRESFLQAARFVGRESEFSVLQEALTASQDGQGVAYLLGGESGVGKSRLMDELRIHALVKGILVLRGQEVSEGGSLYQLWREVLRHLVLQVTLTDAEAAFLKPVIPDLERLLERPIPHSPALSPVVWQERLIKTICNLLERYQKPILLLLEDIHWSGEGLPILQAVSRLAKRMPLVLVASYRNDERHDLAAVLTDMQHIALNRLVLADIKKLGRSILGELPHETAILDYLQVHSEGNVFFLIEVLRALAEQSGALQRIGELTLPEHLITGGIQAVLEQRLSRVPDYAYALLQQAALLGRQVDLAVLEVLVSQMNLEEWLSDCVASAIFARTGEVWEFAHDKIREHILAYMPEEQIQTDARLVAEAVEQVHQGRLDIYASRLAYLWQLAQDTQRELLHRTVAGKQAFQNNANRNAVQHLERAMTLFQTEKIDLALRTKLDIYTNLLTAYRNLYGYSYPKLQEVFEQIQATISQVEADENSLRFFGVLWTYFSGRGEYQKTRDIIAIFNSVFKDSPLEPLYYFMQSNTEIFLACQHFEREKVLDLYQHYRAIYSESLHHRAVEVLGTSPYTALLHYGAAMSIMSAKVQSGLAIADESQALAETLNSGFALAFSLAFMARHRLFIQDYEPIPPYLERLKQVSEKYEINYTYIEYQFFHHFSMAMQTGNFAAAIPILTDILANRRKVDLMVGISTQILWLAEVKLKAGDLSGAWEEITVALEYMQHSGETIHHAEAYRLRGDITFTSGDFEAAESEYRHAIAIAQAQGAQLWELRASIGLAKVLKEAGQRIEAMSLLTPLLNRLHDECYFTQDYKLARQVLMS